MPPPVPLLSVVIPVYNEETLLLELKQRCQRALESMTLAFEIIFVDDGSTDQSRQLLAGMHAQDQRFKVLVLSRNFGHQAAFTAGLHYTKAPYIAMLDGDLQDPPELLPEMFEKVLNDQADVVYGHRTGTRVTGLRYGLTRLFHASFRNMARVPEVDNAGNFAVFNRKAVTALLALPEKNRYLPGLRFFIGFRQQFVSYTRQQRNGSRTKMSYGQLLKLALDAFFSFSDIPLKICLYTGLAGVLIFLLAGFYVISSKILGLAPYGWSSEVLSIYFLGSVQLVFLGILGEYIFRIYRETQNRPLYFVQEFLD